MRLLMSSFFRNCKFKPLYQSPKLRTFGSLSEDKSLTQSKVCGVVAADPSYVEVCPTWPVGEEPELRASVLRDMCVIPNFITEQEEAVLLAELEPVLKRMRYEFDHWDNAIQGYRETERSQWRPENARVLERVRTAAFDAPDAAHHRDTLPAAHVLDLAAQGYIRPHVDAVRFCGPVIAGLCLLSDAVMRLEHSARPHLAVSALLERRCLYIMRGVARYDMTHAVLGAEHSAWRGARVPRGRRLAVITRQRPLPQHTG
ncbi:hypothetical protein evm_012295 [Chilo suppressalis]|nr:hypothetical protein evm_012295 [Chilo suppressalis]